MALGSRTRDDAGVDAAEVRAVLERLADGPAACSDAERVDLLRGLEELKAAAAALQARVSVDLDASQRREQATRGIPAPQQGRGVAAQVALARRDSAYRGSRHLGLAKALVHEMPHALSLMTAGRLSEWRATLLVRETAILDMEHRVEVDRVLCADPSRLEGLGDQRLVAEVRRLAHRLDPSAAVRRCRRAEADRRVTIRPAPDTMARISALVPVAQGVALYAALKRQADSLLAGGDPRSHAQAMADTLVERVTGQACASDVPVVVNLVMPATSLFATGAPGPVIDEPADLLGHGPVPAGWARDLVREAAKEQGTAAAVWFRRLFRHPTSCELVAMDSRARTFPEGLRRFIAARDAGTCRTPWCGAPIRHHDHVVPSGSGGPTAGANGQGLCVQCNHAKQAPGWDAVPRPGPRHTVETTTPTGHRYRSTAPPLPGALPKKRAARVDLMWDAGPQIGLALAS